MSIIKEPQYMRENVIDFYNQLSELEIFGKFDLRSYRVKERSSKPIEPIPEEYVVAYLPDERRGRFYFGYSDQVFTVFEEDGLGQCKSLSLNNSLVLNPPLKKGDIGGFALGRIGKIPPHPPLQRGGILFTE